MERDDVERLLRLRWSYTEQKFNDQIVNDWHEVLVDVTYNDAKAVMVRLEREGRKAIALSDLQSARRRFEAKQPYRGCDDCHGDGWVVSRWDRGAARYLPCRQCQPDHPMLKMQLAPTLDEEDKMRGWER